MSAIVVEGGFLTAGFNSGGQLVQTKVGKILAEVPGPYGEWCFVVIDSDFCWVKGLPENQGYLLYKLPLLGEQATWQEQIEIYCTVEPDESGEHSSVPVGTKTNLGHREYYIIAE